MNVYRENHLVGASRRLAPYKKFAFSGVAHFFGHDRFGTEKLALQQLLIRP